MVVSSYTKPSLYHPKNEDSFIADQKLNLFAVFDGMGGYAGGDIATKIAYKAVLQTFKNQTSQSEDPKFALTQALILVAREIAKDASKSGRQNQGTTGTVILITGPKIFIANVGDSRACGLTRRNQLVRLTVDHSILEELVERKQIPRQVASKVDQAKSARNLAPKEFLLYQRRNIVTNALATDFNPDNINFNQANLNEFKMLILTTDGVHDNLRDEEIKKVLLSTEDPKDAAKNLVEAAYQVSLANNFRSKPDDITAVAISL